MARADFIAQLEALGYQPTEYAGGYVAFAYTVEVGRFAGTEILLGFQVADAFPAHPPGGPHMRPALRPMHPGSDKPHPDGGVHDSPFTSAVGGGTWQYWSRPFNSWGRTDKTVSTYLKFIRYLFDTQ